MAANSALAPPPNDRARERRRPPAGAEAARAIFSRTHEDGWAFDVEVLALAREYGLRVVEVPIDWEHNRDSRVRPFRI